jgi:hypothetical protein
MVVIFAAFDRLVPVITLVSTARYCESTVEDFTYPMPFTVGLSLSSFSSSTASVAVRFLEP